MSYFDNSSSMSPRMQLAAGKFDGVRQSARSSTTAMWKSIWPAIDARALPTCPAPAMSKVDVGGISISKWEG